MSSPLAGFDLDIAAVSGIAGAISIACWVVVFSPQIIENFRRSSADGLSVEFVIIWLFGDIANIIGAVLQGVLPTMIILAIYYTLADIVLLGQCFYYRGFTIRDTRTESLDNESAETLVASERTALLSPNASSVQPTSTDDATDTSRNSSLSTVGDRFANDGHRFSPAVPVHPKKPIADTPPQPSYDTTPHPTKPAQATYKTILFNLTAVVVVFAAGFLGYFLSSPDSKTPDNDHDHAHELDQLTFDTLGQVFGYLCAVLYLGSRVPQLLLNYRRKSTEGLNALFFLFACMGNLTYVLSIFAFEPVCLRRDECHDGEASDVYLRYILVNLSWIIGSAGTLFLDVGVFAQFFIYRDTLD